MVELHGIRNCDTVKRARAWFDEQGVDVAFHDYGRSGIAPALLDRWIAVLGWEALLNRRGTTWRKLDAAAQAAVTDAASARALMLAQPSVIRRPIVAWPDGGLTTGFDAEVFKSRS